MVSYPPARNRILRRTPLGFSSQPGNPHRWLQCSKRHNFGSKRYCDAPAAMGTGGQMRIQHCGALAALLLTGCALQRAQVASDAQTHMVGMSKEGVLACMGPPANKAAEGAVEVWSYPSGNGHTDVSMSGGRTWAAGTSSQRFCTVNVTMAGGQVSRVNFVGPTGGLLTAGWTRLSKGGGMRCAVMLVA